MGCLSSKVGQTPEPQDEEQPALAQHIHVDVVIGSQVKSIVSKHDPLVIMIFGGPGTGKGKIIEHLCSMFDFTLVNGEDLMLRAIPKKMKISRNRVLETNDDIRRFLDEEPYHLSVEALFKLVSQEIAEQQTARRRRVYLVDLMPNLKFMLKNEHLVKDDCSEAIQQFEAHFPGSVTIELSLPVEFLAQTMAPLCAKVSSTTDNPQGQSDEVDMSRTSRRHALYENAARSIVNYYSRAERFIRVDATSGNKEAVWEAVRHLTASLDFPVKKHDDPVVLFNFENLQMDWNRLNMHVVRLLDIAPNADSCSVVSTLEKLAQYVESTSAECSRFVVQVEGTRLATAKTEQLKRTIMFAAPAPGCADQAVHDLNKVAGRPDHFKALCSTEDETLVFPSSTDDEFCRRLTVMFSESHRNC